MLARHPDAFDVVVLGMGEDGHTARTGNGPVNLAILRNTVLTRPDGTGARPGIATLRARARKPERALSALAS